MLPALTVLVEFVKWAAPQLPGLVPLLHAYAREMSLGEPPDLAAWERAKSDGDERLAAEVARRRETVPE